MRSFSLAAVLCIAAPVPSLASTATFTSLVKGGTVGVADVTFSNFTSAQLGTQLIDLDVLDGTASSTSNKVTLDFVFDPELLVTQDDFVEWEF